ncbi:MAG: glycosyltransferase family 39 protein [Chloroflexi bacterium]|nr:glycosyltransferase family 39 protein [Chloroflexota bacterium]
MIVLVAAVLIRVVAALYLGDTAAPISGASDQVSYDTLAQRLLSGHGFSFATSWYPFTLPDEQTAQWSFAYTFYLAGVYALFGHHPLAARLIQVLISALNILLVYRIGRRLFGEWVGLAAAAATAFYAYLIFFNAALMTQTFYILCLLWAMDVALQIADCPAEGAGPRGGLQKKAPRLRDWLLLGVALGVGALMRQTLLLFAPILFAWIWWATLRGSNSPVVRGSSRIKRYVLRLTHKPLIIGTVVSIAVVAALILPFTIRNYVVYHDFLLLNSNSGFWFYSSNHPNQGTNFDPNYVAPIPPELRGLPEPAIDRALLREGIGFIVADPIRFILLSINRTKDYFWLVPSGDSSLISNISRLFSFTLYLPFMVYGLYLSRKNWRLCLPLYLYAAFDTGLCLISWSAPRYRLPTDSLMMVFAGLAVVDVAQRLPIPGWFSRWSSISERSRRISGAQSEILNRKPRFP